MLAQSLDPESSLCPSRYPTVEPRQQHLPRLYVLGFLQQIRGTTSAPIHSEKRDHRLKATSPERGECGNLVSAVRQIWKEHCRSRREDSVPWFWLAAAARLHAQPHSCYVTQSRPRGNPCPHSQADVWGGIYFIGRITAIFGSDSCFALECSPQAEISHQCRCRVADQLSGAETVAGTGRPRQKGPDWQIRAMRRSSMVEKGIMCGRQDTR